MIVEVIKHGECECYIDDSAYVNKTEDEIEEILNQYSAFIAACLLKKKTA